MMKTNWTRNEAGAYEHQSRDGVWMIDRDIACTCWRILEPVRESELERCATLRDAKVIAEQWIEIRESVPAHR